MELRQLRYLSAVVREGGFSAAAQRLAVAQPAISQQLRKLEQELGLELLHRAGGIRPTPSGARLLGHAERALAEIDELVAVAADERGLVVGRVALGSMQWTGSFDLPMRLARFLARNPGVEVTLVERASRDMLAALRRDELDLTLVSLGDLGVASLPDGVDLHVLGEEELAVVGTRAILAAGGPVNLSVLDRRPFVAFARGMNLRAAVDGALKEAGVEPQIVLESNEPATVRALAAHGAGLAVLPRALAEAPGPPLTIRSTAPRPLSRRIGLACRRARRLPPPAVALRDELLAGGSAGRQDASDSGAATGTGT